MTDVWAYYRDFPPPTYDPFKETRALMTHASGHRAGKATKIEAQIEGTRAAIGWLDEYADFLAALYAYPYQAVRDLVVGTPWTEPSTVPEVASVRWACKSPTAPVYAVGSSGWMMEQYQSRAVPENPEHIRKLNEKVQAIYDILGVRPHGANGSEI